MSRLYEQKCEFLSIEKFHNLVGNWGFWWAGVTKKSYNYQIPIVWYLTFKVLMKEHKYLNYNRYLKLNKM